MQKWTNKLLSNIEIADTLKSYLTAKLFDNFVAIFNQWAVSNKLGSMSNHVLCRHERKIDEGKLRKIDLKQLTLLYSEEKEREARNKLIVQQETSRLAQSHQQEFYFGAESSMDLFSEGMVIESDRFSFDNDRQNNNRNESGDSELMNIGFSNGFANVSHDWEFN